LIGCCDLLLGIHVDLGKDCVRILRRKALHGRGN
jgi:hypothetical protein